MYFVYYAIFEKQIKYQLLLLFSQYAQNLANMILSIVLTKTLAKNSIFLLREKNNMSMKFIHDLRIRFPTESNNFEISLPKNGNVLYKNFDISYPKFVYGKNFG